MSYLIVAWVTAVACLVGAARILANKPTPQPVPAKSR
jgi:hypothetical protein